MDINEELASIKSRLANLEAKDGERPRPERPTLNDLLDDIAENLSEIKDKVEDFVKGGL